MTSPTILFDPWPRRAGLIFRPEVLRRFEALGRLVGLAESEGCEANEAGRLDTALFAATVDDLGLLLRGLPAQRLQPARSETVGRWANPPGRTYPAGTKL